jgi:hypothetical protein
VRGAAAELHLRSARLRDTELGLGLHLHHGPEHLLHVSHVLMRVHANALAGGNGVATEEHALSRT